MVWENSTNEGVLERARAEIRKSCGGDLPPVYDPFSGGGSIPLEAQRLGLPAFGSDLNPVAVMIGKAMIEIPPKFKDWEPVHPGGKERNHYRNADGLAEDVKHYGKWMREQAFERIGHLYPQVDLPKEHGGGKATVIAWIWSRTVSEPGPRVRGCAGAHRFEFPAEFQGLARKPGSSPSWTKPRRRFLIVSTKAARRGRSPWPRAGTKAGRAVFRCLLSDTAITSDYVKSQGQSRRDGADIDRHCRRRESGGVFISSRTRRTSLLPSRAFEPSPNGRRVPKFISFRRLRRRSSRI